MTACRAHPALGLILLAGLVPLGAPREARARGKRISILFLGDRGHHRPAERFKELAPPLETRGIDLTYTERMDDLDPAVLSRYDGLIVYANVTSIAPRQEKALLDFVAGGKGFIPLHCASYCFLDSPKYIALVGAQFLRHGTGEFTTRIVAPDHPVMKGFKGFRTWDETYVHTRPNPDRVVLQTRREGAGEEPWTWVRTHGKGRVFYTAYGHDQRTFSNPGFHDLVARGIRWACRAGADAPAPLSPKETIARRKPEPFRYRKAKIAYYPPGGARRGDGEWDRMQLPVSPAESMKHAVLAPGLGLELFAAEPDIVKPIALAWDPRGRLWIAETTDYPNDRQPPGKGRDRIKICEDTDGDGRADRFTLFAEKLSLPTSLLFWRDGIIVHQPPETLFLRDTDGDDRCDERQVLFRGWSIGDTHAGPSNLRWGLDNWVWGIVGYAGFRGVIGGEERRFSTGFYRFRPDGSDFEFIRNTNNNSWGLGFTEDGLVFGSTANGNPSVYMPIPNRYYEAVRGWSSRRLERTAASSRFFPITDRVRQVDNHGSFTAGAGHAVYTARRFPREYWNRTAFVNGPTGHLVGTFVIERNGSDIVTRNSWNLLASDDEWTAPIVAEVGPDGAVWVIDWYNYIVQHNPTPAGFRTGKGSAYETELRDKRHGRIYRIVPENGPPYRPMRLDRAGPAELVAALSDDNQFWRMTAQRLLVERGKSDVVADLLKLTRDRSVDEIDLNCAAIHALWTLHGLGVLGRDHPEVRTAVFAALRHPSAGVRRAALGVLPPGADSVKALLEAGSLADPDGQVRLAAFLALADQPPAPGAGRAIVEAMKLDANRRDRWIPEAATSAAARHDASFLAAAIALPEADSRLLEIIARVAEHHARGAPEKTVASLVASLKGARREVADSIVGGLARGWPEDRPLELDAEADAGVLAVLDGLSPPSRSRLVRLAARWGSRGIEEHTRKIVASLLQSVELESSPAEERRSAARQLVELRPDDREVVERILGAITVRTPPPLAEGLLDALSASRSDAVGSEVVAASAGLTPSLERKALQLLTRRAAWTRALLAGAEAGDVDLDLLPLDQKQNLARHPDQEIARRARKLLLTSGDLPSPDRQKVIDQLLPVVKKGGDAARGKEVFKKVCSKCHLHGGEGNDIAPDLTGMAALPKEELLIHILDPNRSVAGNYRQYTAVTTDGTILSGMLASETKTAVEIFDTEGQRHLVLREDIAQLDSSRTSVMPEGFENQVDPRGFADLLEFLGARGKFLPLPIARVATIVTTRGMFYSESADHERLIFPDWKPKVVEGVPFRLVDPRGDRVPNAVMLYSPNGKLPPSMPRSVSVPCNSQARAIHLLSGVSGWGSQQSIPKGGSVSMVVRLEYADGSTEDHPLLNGLHFADYIGPFEVPGSKLAFKLRGQQIRYLAVRPKRSNVIRQIDLVKGPDGTAPIVMAMTVELPGAETTANR